MIIIDNVPIMTTIYQILVVLQRELHINNIHYLNDIVEPKNSYQDVFITCPFHHNGMEHHPSCGVLTHQKNDIPAGTYHCFSCKSSGSISELVSYCFGKSDGGVFGKKWILSHFASVELEDREGFFNKIKDRKPIKIEQTYIDNKTLDKYRYYHSYMYKRHLTDDIIDIFDIGYDKEFQLGKGKPFECITFPVRDINGNVVFIARRSIRGKIYNYPSDVDKGNYIYGLYEINKLFPEQKELYVCESFLNALMLIKWGKCACALMGTGTYNQMELLKHTPYRTIILSLDNDKAGTIGTDKIYKYLKNYKLLKILTIKDKSKDINDLGYLSTFEEFEKCCQKT